MRLFGALLLALSIMLSGSVEPNSQAHGAVRVLPDTSANEAALNGRTLTYERIFEQGNNQFIFTFWRQRIDSQSRELVQQFVAPIGALAGWNATANHFYADFEGGGNPVGQYRLKFTSAGVATPASGSIKTVGRVSHYSRGPGNGTVNCGELEFENTRFPGGSFVTRSEVDGQPALPSGGCSEKIATRPFKDTVVLRVYSGGGKRIATRHLRPWGINTETQPFDYGREAIDTAYKRWRATNLQTKQQEVHTSVPAGSLSDYVFGGPDSSAIAPIYLGGSGRARRFAIAYYPRASTSDQHQIVGPFVYGRIDYGYCGKSVVYLDRNRERAFQFNPESGQKSLLLTMHGRKIYSGFTCDAHGAIFWGVKRLKVGQRLRRPALYASFKR